MRGPDSVPQQEIPDDVQRMSRHLIGLSTAMRLRMSGGLVARGHDLRASTAQVIPNLPIEGLRVTELAARLRLTNARRRLPSLSVDHVRDIVKVANDELTPVPRHLQPRIIVCEIRGTLRARRGVPEFNPPCCR